jgi:hypothetical protein
VIWLVPPAVVTCTSTTPAPPGGAVAVHDVAVQVPGALFRPKLTTPPARWVPVTVIVLPPATGPLAGLTAVTVGRAGAGAS